MKRHRVTGPTRMTAIALVSATLLALSGCRRDTPVADVPADMGDTADTATTDAGRDMVPSAVEDSPAAFDINSVPVSDVPLGVFPYFAMPAGYKTVYTQTVDYDRIPFWTGDGFESVEGRVFSEGVWAGDKPFSSLEVQKNIEQLITQVGGVRIAEGRIDRKLRKAAYTDAGVSGRYTAALGSGAAPVRTYVIRRADRAIWVHLSLSNRRIGSGWVIAETAPFVATATLLPADALRQQLDASGKAVVQVNFASDEAVILADSQPQIAQVVELLNANPALKLSINGHTDNSGDAARNQALSELRAQAVVAALTVHGIEASRLQARGFGASGPVADNGDDAGRAKNRRVELVRL